MFKFSNLVILKTWPYSDNVSIWYSVLTHIFMFHFIMQRWNHWTWNAHLLSSVFAGQLPYFARNYEFGGQYRHLFNAIHEPRWIQSLKGSYQFAAYAVYRVFCCITTPYHSIPYHAIQCCYINCQWLKCIIAALNACACLFKIWLSVKLTLLRLFCIPNGKHTNYWLAFFSNIFCTYSFS